MAKVNFTAARVEAHKCVGGVSQSFLWDSRAPGLGLRTTAGGAKSYIFQGRIHGDTVRVTIGNPLSWSIERAQEEARRLQTLLDSGKDPREHRAEQQAAYEARQDAARRQEATFGGAWDAYLIARKAKWSDRHYSDHLQHADEGGKPRKRGDGKTVAGPLATLRPLKLSVLSGERIAQWLDKEGSERPTMVALSYRLLRAFIRWAAETPEYRDLIPADAYKARTVKDAVPRVKAKDGDCLQQEQLADWFGAVRRIQNPVVSTYLQALLITGARREEMAALTWDDVDFRWRSLSIADKVEETGRVIPLTPYLASLLLQLKRINEARPNVRELARLANRGEEWSPSPWVFRSKTAADGKIAEPRLAHNQALAAGGLPHITLHGLRRSFGTLSEWTEVPTGIVAQIMGHKPSAIVEKHYRRRPLDLLRKWHDTVEAQLLEQAGIEFDAAEVLPALRAVK